MQGDLAAARSLTEESLAIGRELGDRRGVVECLERLAAVSGADGHLPRSARLLGAAEALREAIGAPLSASDRADLGRVAATVRSRLAQPACAAAWAEGRAMTVEQAIAYALSEDEEA